MLLVRFNREQLLKAITTSLVQNCRVFSLRYLASSILDIEANKLISGACCTAQIKKLEEMLLIIIIITFQIGLAILLILV